MKKLILAGIMSVCTIAAIQAQESTAPQSDRYTTPTDQQQPAQEKEKDGKEVAATDLPMAVQEKLKSTDYTGWTVEKAKTKMKDGKTCYAVELKNGSDMKKIMFDEQGNIMKEKE